LDESLSNADAMAAKMALGEQAWDDEEGMLMMIMMSMLVPVTTHHVLMECVHTCRIAGSNLVYSLSQHARIQHIKCLLKMADAEKIAHVHACV
jgi:hypothetical protein